MKRLYYTSGFLASAANGSRTRSKDHTEAVFATILLGYSTVEAFLSDVANSANTCSQAPAEPKEVKQFAVLAAELERSDESLLKQIQCWSVIFSGAPLDKSCNPLQDFELLRSTRNALVHPKPERVNEVEQVDEQRTDRVKNIVRGLESRKLIPPPGYEYAWMELIQDPRISEWTVQTVLALVNALEKMLPPCRFCEDVNLLAGAIRHTFESTVE